MPDTDCVVHARVVRVIPSLESALYATAEIALTNDGVRTCAVTRYCVRWPGGEVAYEPRDLVLAAHSTMTRTVRIEPPSGDVSGLLHAADFTVEILAAMHR